MTWWSTHFLLEVYGIAGAAVAAAILIRWLGRCRHPNPHYIRAVTTASATGQDAVQPARYLCYECGKSWPAAQRDPAWMPTHPVQKFYGYDERKAVRAATRAVVEQEQRRFLAAHRAVPDSPARDLEPARRRKRLRAANVIDLNSRKPA
jgi:hypothetical protein